MPSQSLHSPMRDAREQIVVDLYRAALGTSEIAADDDFVAMGGDSMTAVSIASRLRREFGVRVGTSAVLRHATPRRLAAHLASCGQVVSDDVGDWSDPDARLPLSFEQHLVWFQQQLFPESMAYTSHAVLRFDGALNVAALRTALDETVTTHDMLRSTVVEDEGEPYQRIAPTAVADFELLQTPSTLSKDALRERILQEFRRPFDLAGGPLIRWRLACRTPSQHFLLHSEHHIIHDGLTFGLIATSMLDRYAALTHPAAARPVTPEASYARHVRRQRAWYASGAAERDRDYWCTRLAGGTTEPLLTRSVARPARLGQAGSAVRFEVLPAVLQPAKALACDEGTTLFAVLFTAFASAVAARSGASDLNIASSFANRPPDMTDVVGMFVNNVVLRMRTADAPTGRDRLRMATATILDALDHQQFPFTEVVRALDPPRSPSYNPLAQLCFSFDHALDYAPWPPDLRVSVKEGVTIGYSKFDMNVICVHQRRGSGPDGAERMSVKWEYSAELFDHDTVVGLIEDWLTYAVAISTDPDAPLADSLPVHRSQPVYQFQDRVFPDAGALRGWPLNARSYAAESGSEPSM